MASENSSLDSNGSNESLTHSYSKSEQLNPQTPSLPVTRDYEVTSNQCYLNSQVSHGMSSQYEYESTKANEGLKQQCEKALHDLNQLRRQHSETSRRCEHAMKELEYFRGQHRAAMSQLEVSAQEASSLRGKYGELLTDKQRLEREVQHLHESAGSEALGAECARLSLRVEELRDQLRVCLEEKTRALQQSHDLARERANLQAQLASALRHCEGNRMELRNALKQPHQDLKRLADERNAAMHEYTLIMSERDTVHKEMEKLSDDLQTALKRVAALELALQASRNEQRATALQAESLRREIASALQDRDRALKECSDLKSPQNTSTLGKRQENSAYHLGLTSAGKDGFLNGQHSNAASLDKLQGLSVSLDKERVDNLEQANQQLERLRKHVDRLQQELAEAQQEAEVSKRRRDWAFSERDKIVQERESIRTLCDRLRKERDRAVSDLAEALRDSDDIKKQRNEASKELKELREKFETEMDKDNSRPRHGISHSAEPSIDGNSPDLEWEIIEVELNGLTKDSSLGFEIGGGRDEPLFPNDNNIYVTNVVKGSPAEGKIKVRDVLLKANGLGSFRSVRSARSALRSLSLTHLSLTLRRVSANTCSAMLRDRRGIALTHGIFISKIAAGSAAFKEDKLLIGDRLISINNRSLEGMKSVSEAMMLLNDCQYDTVAITVSRPFSFDNAFLGRASPMRDGNRNVYNHSYLNGKMVNSCSQTEEPFCHYQTSNIEPKVHIDHGVTDFERRYVYHVGAGSQGKIHHERGTWDMIRDKIEAVTGRSKSKDKQNKIPESDAIAELDSVIDSYHGKPTKETGSVLKRSRRKNKDSQNDPKNGGTWPKARANFILEENPTGTIVQPRSRKERPPLSILLSPPTKLQPEPQRSNTNRNSNPIPLGHQSLAQAIAPARHSVYKSMETAPNAQFPKPAPLSIHNPFATTPLAFDKLRSLEKDKSLLPDYAEHELPNRLSLALEPSDDSLDYQPVVRNRNKSPQSGGDILSQYYSGKKVPGKVKYGSDSDSLGSSLALTPRRAAFASRSGESLRCEGTLRRHYDAGTFPRDKEERRFRVPSNPSVASKSSAGKLSTGSIERSERNSPMPTFHVEVLSPGRASDRCLGWNEPLPGELRRVHIDKSRQPLGIQISCPPGSGGVFVSTVNDNSIAKQVGLQVGDQLLEVCGINMRSATYTLAANVLRQCGNSITMLVQYSPEKYKYEMEGSGSSSSNESSHEDEASLSGSPTPRNSPGPQQSLRLEAVSSEVPTLRQSQGNKDLPRFLLIEMRNCSDLGISLVGGNAVGIFVHSVQVDSPAYNAGLRTGDQIMEYNNVDLRHATAEQAALELAKPADKVSVLVRHDLQQYHDIKDKPGDAFYIRAGFDRCTKITSTGMDTIDPYSLWFRKDEVLFVDNTLFNGAPGLWRAWQLDYKGVKQQWGTIPSKFKVEELLRRSMGSLEGDRQTRASTTARRSFFRRKKHRDSKELASFSNTDSGWYSDSPIEEIPQSYQRVERLNYGSHRPVVVLGPLHEFVVSKLVSDWPSAFARASWQPLPLTASEAQRALHKGTHLEPRRLTPGADTLHCIPAIQIQDMANKGIHCILDISVATLEKLHKQQIYPIVLLIKFKSTKQIKEVKDSRYPADKVSAKAAKEMYEHALKLETEYRSYISAVIPAGVNIAYMCTQLKAAVEEEQNKTLWVPSVQA